MDEHAASVVISSPMSTNVEAIPMELRAHSKVVVHQLRKRYADGKLAVKDLSFAMLEGQITCLLGANGTLVCVYV